MFGIDILGFARDMYDMYIQMLVSFIATSVDLTGTDIVISMLGNAKGVGVVLTGYVALACVLGAIVARRYRLNALLSFVIVMFAPLVFTLWLTLLDGLRATGTSLTAIIVGIDTTSIQASIVIPYPPLTITAAMWNVPVFVLSGVMALWFMIVFAEMAIVNILIAVVGIWLAAAYGLGPRTRRAFSIAISFALVTFCLGQPVVLAIMKLANFIGGFMPVIPGSVGLAGLIGLAGMFIAAMLLLVLPFLIYLPVNSIVGRVISSVSNRVQTQVSNKHRVDAKVSGRVTTQSNRFGSTQKPSYRAAMSSEIRRQVGSTVSIALMGYLKKSAAAAAAVGSNVHPAAKAAFVSASLLARGIGNAQHKTKKNGGLDAYR